MSDRGREVQDGDPHQCGIPDCKTVRETVKPISLCGRHRLQVRRGKLVITLTDTDSYLLPEDGVLDAWAAYIAANGYRSKPVRLSERERILATSMILALDREDTLDLIVARLGVAIGTALHLIEKVQAAGIDLHLDAFGELDVNFQPVE